jgi:hypothetical protein
MEDMLTNSPSHRCIKIELLEADRASHLIFFVLDRDQPCRHELLEMRNIEDHRLCLGFCKPAIHLALLAVHHHDKDNRGENEQSSRNIAQNEENRRIGSL